MISDDVEVIPEYIPECGRNLLLSAKGLVLPTSNQLFNKCGRLLRGSFGHKNGITISPSHQHSGIKSTIHMDTHFIIFEMALSPL